MKKEADPTELVGYGGVVLESAGEDEYEPLTIDVLDQDGLPVLDEWPEEDPTEREVRRILNHSRMDLQYFQIMRTGPRIPCAALR